MKTVTAKVVIIIHLSNQISPVKIISATAMIRIKSIVVNCWKTIFNYYKFYFKTARIQKAKQILLFIIVDLFKPELEFTCKSFRAWTINFALSGHMWNAERIVFNVYIYLIFTQSIQKTMIDRKRNRTFRKKRIQMLNFGHMPLERNTWCLIRKKYKWLIPWSYFISFLSNSISNIWIMNEPKYLQLIMSPSIPISMQNFNWPLLVAVCICTYMHLKFECSCDLVIFYNNSSNIMTGKNSFLSAKFWIK